jgi:Flp pilus assembly protein TadD
VSKNKSFAIILFLVIVTAGVYWQVKDHEFIAYDDGQYIVENIGVQRGLTMESIRWAFTTGYAANWHPLTWISHIVDYQLYGLNPTGHHLTNLAFHILNSILLFLVFHRMTNKMWQSAFVAAVFALHPMHVESVAWAAERKDVLSALFWILSIGAYIRYCRHPGIGRYLLVLLMLVLGLLSKPMVVTLPFVFLLLDYWPLGRIGMGASVARMKDRRGGLQPRSGLGMWTLLKEKLPFFVAIVLSSAVTFIVQKRGGAVSPIEGLPLSIRIGNAIVGYAGYLSKTIWPVDLAIMYPHPGKLPPAMDIVIAVFILLAITVMVWKFRENGYLVTGWLWFVGTLVPVIGIVQVGRQAMADRYSYIPMIGISMMVAWGVSELLKRYPRKQLVYAAAAAVVVAMSLQTWMQVGYWKDGEHVFRRAMNSTKDNYVAITNLGVALHKQNRTAEAETLYRKALLLDPTYEITHYNLGLIAGQAGRLAEARSQLEEAIRLNPGYSEAHNNLGIVYAQEGKPEEAIHHFNEALRINPLNADALFNLGIVTLNIGRYSDAIASFNNVLRLAPNHPQARESLLRATQLQQQKTAL